ncbi:MAG TPA: hypothetical protein VM529_02155, partial [Gemmata sp.]|nr:hypothetical protein [Gemmata sp.]
LKRIADAERDGDRIYCVIRGVGVADDYARALPRAAGEAGGTFADVVPFEATADVGETGAASAAASLAKACLALWQETLPGTAAVPAASDVTPTSGGDGRGPREPRYWLHDRANGPRRAAVSAGGADGSRFVILLEEYAKIATDAPAAPERLQPLGARDEAVFVVEGNDAEGLLAGLEALQSFVGRAVPDAGLSGTARPTSTEAVARAWFREAPPSGGSLAVSFVARSVSELEEQIAFATENLRANPIAAFPASAKPALRDRVFFSPTPLGPDAKVAFVYPGSGNHFAGMGRDLSAQWPEVLRRQQAESELLRSQFAPDLFWDEPRGKIPPRDLMFGQVTVGSLVSDIAVSLGIQPHAMIGLSLGESAGLFGVRTWQSRDEMFRRMQQSTLFNSDLAPPYDAARRHWQLPDGEPIDWAIGLVAAAPDEVRAALRPEWRAYLLIVNTAAECVIGGLRGDVEKLADTLGKTITPVTGVTLAHCEAGKPVEGPYRELHTLPVTAPGVAVYSGAWGEPYEPTDSRCAESITAGLLQTIDVPAVVEAAYRDGVRVFVEVGPGNSCVRMIDAVLGDRSHLARAAHAAKQDAVSQVLRLVAHLAAERVPVDLAALYRRESHCVAHREPKPKAREIVIPVGQRPADLSERRGASPPFGQVAPAGSRRAARQDDEPRRSAPALTGVARPMLSPAILAPAIEATANVHVLTAQAQAVFLRMSQQYTETAAGLIRFQTELLGAMARGGSLESDVWSLESRQPATP